ncbi:hypothetical protein BXZ70DRAFT_541015 [Cristinia sonorae]|uniref:Uncharacterized protein n=1 Tax=Cristinia sonorae TaxID=1940300 RepID=A0A8K0UI65_9AGAR|nr:hypothetical protein BXZ70DRAFT_541015 [Cristinia sonorae]
MTFFIRLRLPIHVPYFSSSFGVSLITKTLTLFFLTPVLLYFLPFDSLSECVLCHLLLFSPFFVRLAFFPFPSHEVLLTTRLRIVCTYNTRHELF